MNPLIELQNISKIYQGVKIDTLALSKINLAVQEGEFISLMGSSGSGKSTLLHLIGLLDKPTNGKYLYNNQNVLELNKSQRSALRKFNIGFVFQDFNLIGDLSVYDNVELPLIYLREKAGERKDKVVGILERLGLMHKADQFPESLSGGQQQRVAVARAIVTKPKLILADEPTGNLDTGQGNEVMEILSELNQDGTTIVMATHNFNDAAYSKRLIKMLDGQIIAENISLNVA